MQFKRSLLRSTDQWRAKLWDVGSWGIVIIEAVIFFHCKCSNSTRAIWFTTKALQVSVEEMRLGGKWSGLAPGHTCSRWAARTAGWCVWLQESRDVFLRPRVSEAGTLSSTDLQHESPCAQEMPDWLQTHHSLFSSCEQCLADSLPLVSASLINSHIENPDFSPH